VNEFLGGVSEGTDIWSQDGDRAGLHNRKGELMRCTLKNYALSICLFVFLFVMIGAGFHLGPGGALLGAISGTPLVIFACNRWYSAQIQAKEPGREQSANPPLQVHNRL
jgi:hypothetical protein